MRVPGIERRRYDRYDTEVKIYFSVDYDVKTKVKFRVVNNKKGSLSEKYSAFSRNISAEGMQFISDKRLRKLESLYLEVYLPRHKEPICMTGQVRWSKIILENSKDKHKFSTGVKIISVSGKLVSESIYFDRENGVMWSAVLESILGAFRKFMQKRKAARCAREKSGR